MEAMYVDDSLSQAHMNAQHCGGGVVDITNQAAPIPSKRPGIASSSKARPLQPHQHQAFQQQQQPSFPQQQHQANPVSGGGPSIEQLTTRMSQLQLAAAQQSQGNGMSNEMLNKRIFELSSEMHALMRHYYAQDNGQQPPMPFPPQHPSAPISMGCMPSSPSDGLAPKFPNMNHSEPPLPSTRPSPTQQTPPVHQPQVACITALVEFKRQRIKKFECPTFIAPGQYVVVDGDRGTDCGLVVRSIVRNSDGSLGRTESLEGITIDETKLNSQLGKVHRVATANEVNVLHGEIASMERHALRACREKSEQYSLPIEVVDCEYQFDRKKVTFYFESNDAVDFRDLVKDLYRTFGSRIWMENINPKVKNTVPTGALSQSQKMAVLDRTMRSGLGNNRRVVII